jgi:hypothetical protein
VLIFLHLFNLGVFFWRFADILSILYIYVILFPFGDDKFNDTYESHTYKETILMSTLKCSV